MPKLGRFAVCERIGEKQEVAFGLVNHQLRDEQHDFVHNSWWFVLDSEGWGHQIGTGDLSMEDIRNIAANLQAGERWLIIRESMAYWVGGVPLHAACLNNVAMLNRDQVMKAAYLIISSEQVLVVDEEVTMLDGFTSVRRVELSRYV